MPAKEEENGHFYSKLSKAVYHVENAISIRAAFALSQLTNLASMLLILFWEV